LNESKIEYISDVLKQKRERKTKMYLTLNQKNQVIQTTNIESLYLLEFYMSKSNLKNYDIFNDSNVSKSLPFTTRKVKDLRQLLVRCGFIYRITTSSKRDNLKVVLTYIGLDKVNEIKNKTSYTNITSEPE
jgi:hypothetical protein